MQFKFNHMNFEWNTLKQWQLGSSNSNVVDKVHLQDKTTSEMLFCSDGNLFALKYLYIKNKSFS